MQFVVIFVLNNNFLFEGNFLFLIDLQINVTSLKRDAMKLVLILLHTVQII